METDSKIVARRKRLLWITGGGLAAVGLGLAIAWLAIHGDSQRAASKSIPVQKSTGSRNQKDASSETARNYVQSIQKGQARGAVYGVEGGQVKELSPDRADAMRRASAIRDQLRALRAGYQSALDLKRAGAAAQADQQLARSRQSAVEGLKRESAADVCRELDAFRQFLGTDQEAITLFEEVAKEVGA